MFDAIPCKLCSTIISAVYKYCAKCEKALDEVSNPYSEENYASFE